MMRQVRLCQTEAARLRMSMRPKILARASPRSYATPISDALKRMISQMRWSRITLNDLKRSRAERALPDDDKIYGIEHHYSHSLYLTALVERGIVGILSLILLMC